MTDSMVSSVASALIGAIVGGVVSFFLARQQSQTQLKLAKEQIAAQEKQISDQRRWEVGRKAVTVITEIFTRVNSINIEDQREVERLRAQMVEHNRAWHNNIREISYQLELAGMAGGVTHTLDSHVASYLRALEDYAAGRMSWDALNDLRVETRAALIDLVINPDQSKSM